MHPAVAPLKKSLFLWITAKFTRVRAWRSRSFTGSCLLFCYFHCNLCKIQSFIATKTKISHNFRPPILHQAECLSRKRCHDSAGRTRSLCFHICKGWSQGWGKLVFFPPIFSVLVVYQLLPNTLPAIRPKAPPSRVLHCCYTQLCWKTASLFSPHPNTKTGPRWLLTPA